MGNILNCNSNPINFKEYKSIFKLLNSMENEIAYFNNQRKNTDNQSEEYRLYSNYISKVTSILNFLKYKPLLYIVERFDSFKDIVNRFYYSVYTTNIAEYDKAKNDLEEFIFRMNDYNNGIRYSISPVEIETNNRNQYDNNDNFNNDFINAHLFNSIDYNEETNNNEESKDIIFDERNIA